MRGVKIAAAIVGGTFGGMGLLFVLFMGLCVLFGPVVGVVIAFVLMASGLFVWIAVSENRSHR